MRKPIWTLLVVSIGLILVLPTAKAMAGQRAEYFFPSGEILKVRISPNGDWVVATAVNEKTYGLFAQRFGSAEVEVVESSATQAKSIDWVDGDTLIARFGQGNSRRFLRVDFIRTEQGGFEVKQRWFRPRGYMVDSLPLVDDFLLWGFDRGGRNSVHRVTFDDIVDFPKSARIRRGSIKIGKTVASIKGITHGWIVDRKGTPVVAMRRDENGYTIFYRAGEGDKLKKLLSY